MSSMARSYSTLSGSADVPVPCGRLFFLPPHPAKTMLASIAAANKIPLPINVRCIQPLSNSLHQGFASQVHHRPDSRGRVRGMENGSSGDQDLRSGADYLPYILRPDAPVHLYPEVVIIPLAHLPKLANFFRGLGNEGLPPESRVNRHDEHMIHLAEDFREHTNRGRRINDYAGTPSLLANHSQSAVQMGRRFLMNGNHVCSGGGKSLDIHLGIFDH